MEKYKQITIFDLCNDFQIAISNNKLKMLNDYIDIERGFIPLDVKAGLLLYKSNGRPPYPFLYHLCLSYINYPKIFSIPTVELLVSFLELS